MSKDVGARGGGDAYPILQWLGENYPGDVIAVGQLRGDPPPGVLSCDISMKGLDLPGRDGFFDVKDFEERMQPSLEFLREHEVGCWFDMFGPTPSWSHPDNPAYANVYDFGVLYSLPQLWLMHKLDKPRYGIVTDPKCYKRDGEMATMWPNITPRAVLSQENRIWKKKIQGKTFTISAIAAGCEFWQTWNMKRADPCVKQHDFLVASNVHASSSQLPARRRDLWERLVDELPDGTVICGHGWDEAAHSLDRFDYRGCLKSVHEVYDLMRQSRAGVMVPQTLGFNSTKPRLYALNNCAPYFYSEDQAYVYDVEAVILERDSEWRWFGHLPTRHNDDAAREEYIDLILERTKPDFTTLSNLIADTAEGGHIGDYCGGYYG